ncbi:MULTISPECIES: dihydroneopterin aldolase [Hyphomonas]|uniref:7,8-dihydroneopterin aldolase n=1 Tax=Hyphomonas adhaerens TaxID=81029 RepID=A0A3B9H0B3_9PROT|nr:MULTISPECIES: dihydroneopterin aldolase [Hyphomonas]MBB41751.1 dihydroneopterin aldolase [Hyphomonas sp.]HAE27886.1 dihydroneopterin aldolase [Hyphomonas adhaerens]|tara:strand:+ start:601 stop:966 length:366 start_codon:yes stop_codon:yes gene_type:complete
MTDHVFVTNLCLHGFHGLHKAENSLGQKFYIDLDCELMPQAAHKDEMSETVHYGELCDLAERLSGETVFNLIETFAERIAFAILEDQPLVQRVTVTVRKPSAPIRHFVDHVGVVVIRSRDG